MVNLKCKTNKPQHARYGESKMQNKQTTTKQTEAKQQA